MCWAHRVLAATISLWLLGGGLGAPGRIAHAADTSSPSPLIHPKYNRLKAGDLIRDGVIVEKSGFATRPIHLPSGTWRVATVYSDERPQSAGAKVSEYSLWVVPEAQKSMIIAAHFRFVQESRRYWRGGDCRVASDAALVEREMFGDNASALNWRCLLIVRDSPELTEGFAVNRSCPTCKSSMHVDRARVAGVVFPEKTVNVYMGLVPQAKGYLHVMLYLRQEAESDLLGVGRASRSYLQWLERGYVDDDAIPQYERDTIAVTLASRAPAVVESAKPTATPKSASTGTGVKASVPEGAGPTTPIVVAASDESMATERRLKDLEAQLASMKGGRPPSAGSEPAEVRSVSARALVIGNSGYAVFGTLAHSRDDAADVASRLRKLGVTVELIQDADRRAIVAAVARLRESASEYGLGFFYYAGHSVQADGANYLIPVDFQGADLGAVKTYGIRLDSIIGRLPGRMRLAFIDASWANPLNSGNSPLSNRGLAPISVERGTNIAVAAAPGRFAESSSERNSAFTAGLLAILGERIDVPGFLDRLRERVARATRGRQEPSVYQATVNERVVMSIGGEK